jgi:two-component system sensor histidine kinase BaeS
MGDNACTPESRLRVYAVYFIASALSTEHPPVKLNVGTKLWLGFMGTITFCVLALYLLLHNSLRQGFLDYTSQQSVQRLEILRNALENIHQEEGSFQPLEANPARWLNLKKLIFVESQSLFTGIPQDQNVENLSPQAYYREFVSSISLHDSDKRLMLGVSKRNQALSWIPLIDSGNTVGFVSFVKPTVVSRVQDQNFIQHQFKIFGIISLLVLLIATLVATLFARRISRPLTALAEHAQALAAGDYSKKMQTNSHDEIGQLCNSFNQLSETLAANQRSRALWIADISHEIRTPLSVLKLQIEAMQDGIRPVDHKSLALLHSKCSGMSDLIDDLFELSLSDIGALSYHKKNTAIAPLLQTCIEHYQVKAETARLALQDQIESTTELYTFADPHRLQQLLSNLLENSIRYTHPGGVIVVGLTASETHIQITVDDSPPGVDETQHARLFERLFRLENSRSRDTGGAGLGLSICQKIVNAHQGSITAATSPLGGLRIRVDLPRTH